MKTWKWMAGMRYTRPQYLNHHRVSEWEIEQGCVFDEDCRPDWNDPATRGCLLDQVRRRHAAECWVEYRTGKGWRVVYPVGEETKVVITEWHGSEAEALLAALEEMEDG